MGRSPWTPIRSVSVRRKVLSGLSVAALLLLCVITRTLLREPVQHALIVVPEVAMRRNEPAAVAETTRVVPTLSADSTDEDLSEPDDPPAEREEDDALMPPHEDVTEGVPLTIEE